MEKIVTAREVTIAELRNETKEKTRRAFIYGLILGMAIGAVLCYWVI